MICCRYLLLVIYAFFNMNNQGWGTREGPKATTDAGSAKVICFRIKSFGLFWFCSIISKYMSNDINIIWGNIKFTIPGWPQGAGLIHQVASDKLVDGN